MSVFALFRRSARSAPRCAALLLLLSWARPATAETVLRVPQDVSTLQGAINQIPDGGTIEMAAGTYAAPASAFLIQNLGKGFTIRAAPAATVTLDGQNTRTILKFMNASVASGRPVVFENLIFANGRSTTGAVGGGLTLRFAQATFRGCTFRNNRALTPAGSSGGGGILASDRTTLFIFDSLFEDNVATNEGAGLKIDGTAAPPSVVFIHRTQFINNLANPSSPAHRSTAAGGGVHVGNAYAWITNCRFVGNEAGYVGGAVFAIGSWSNPVSTPRAEVYIANSTFVGNKARANGTATPDPPEAGAIHVEDQATMKVWNSRFESNEAGVAGAANTYRAILEIRDSVFRGNRATATGPGTGFGGAIAAISNDTSVDGANNRRSATLVVTGSLLQGRFGATTTTAQSAGCLFAAGDTVRRQGQQGLPQVTDPTLTRAHVTLDDLVFDDCDVASMATTPNSGGFQLNHVEGALSNLLVIESDALGTGSSGGGGRIIGESVVSITDSVFAKNSAVQFGGGLYFAGSDVDVTGGAFLHNQVTGFGSALFVTGQVNFPLSGQHLDAEGVISEALFSENSGNVPIFDDDRDNGTFINDARYNQNSFWPPGAVYQNPQAGAAMSAAQLNTLVVDRDNPNIDTVKSQVDNSQLGSAPVATYLRAVPPSTIAAVAAGDTESSTRSWAGLAWTGGSATFDGNPVAGNAELVQVAAGTHTLEVGATQSQDAVATGPVPAATLTASPEFILSGQSSTLTWATTSGVDIDGALDQGLPAPAPNDGSQLVTPVATTEYTFLAVTRQGGATARATVNVNALDLEPIFDDGFESGNTAAWSDQLP